jgi:hypothetical protein
MKHKELITKSLEKASSQAFRENKWGQRHVAAWNEPQPVEAGVVGMVNAAAIYADHHRQRFESKLGDDGVLGDPWADVLRSVLVLLNGDIGRLDGGTVDGLVRSMLREEGFLDD